MKTSFHVFPMFSAREIPCGQPDQEIPNHWMLVCLLPAGMIWAEHQTKASVEQEFLLQQGGNTRSCSNWVMPFLSLGAPLGPVSFLVGGIWLIYWQEVCPERIQWCTALHLFALIIWKVMTRVVDPIKTRRCKKHLNSTGAKLAPQKSAPNLLYL